MWCVTGWWRHDWGEGRQGKDTRPLLGSTYPHSRYHPNTHHIFILMQILSRLPVAYFEVPKTITLKILRSERPVSPISPPYIMSNGTYEVQSNKVFGFSPLCLSKWAHMQAIHFPNCNQVHSVWPHPAKSLDALYHITMQLLHQHTTILYQYNLD